MRARSVRQRARRRAAWDVSAPRFHVRSSIGLLGQSVCGRRRRSCRRFRPHAGRSGLCSARARVESLKTARRRSRAKVRWEMSVKQQANPRGVRRIPNVNDCRATRGQTSPSAESIAHPGGCHTSIALLVPWRGGIRRVVCRIVICQCRTRGADARRIDHRVGWSVQERPRGRAANRLAPR